MRSSAPHLPGKTGFPALRLMMLATLVALAVALWYLAAHQLRGTDEVAWFDAATPCDLPTAPCTATLAGEGRLQFAIAPSGPIRALEPVTLRVALAGVAAQSVRVDFVGRDMDMGLHRFWLTRQPDGSFAGQGQVPLCTEAVMPWQAQVVVETPTGALGSRFNFSVERSRL